MRPATLFLPIGEAVFAVQDYAGQYVGYVCPDCHPNRKWIYGLWRSSFGVAPLPKEFQSDFIPMTYVSRTLH